MTESYSQPVGTLSPRLNRSDAVRQFIRRDKTPVAILLMAALVGTLAGLLGVAFDKAVEWVQQQRLASLAQVADSWILVWPLAFILSAALAAGCSVVVKPAAETSLTTLRVAEMAVEAGLPPSAVLQVTAQADGMPLLPSDPENGANRRIELLLLTSQAEGLYRELFGDTQVRVEYRAEGAQLSAPES